MTFVTRIMVALLVLIPIGTTVSAQEFSRIKKQEFENYVRWLDLNTDQTEIARVFYQDYLDDWNVDFLPRLRAYVSSMPGWFEEGYQEALRNRAEEDAQIRNEIAERDAALHQNLESILFENQKPRLQRMYFGRERTLWRVGRGALPEGNVDLVDLAIQLEMNETELELVNAILDEYETVLVQALKRSRHAKTEYNAVFHRWQKLKHQLQDSLKDLDAGQAYDMQMEFAKNRFTQYKKKTVKILSEPGKNLLRINRECFRRITDVLSDENKQAFEREYMQLAYPEVYPDPATANVLYAQLLEVDSDIPRDQLPTIESMRAEFERLHTRLSTQMAESILRRCRAPKEDAVNGDMILYEEWQILYGLGEKRELLNEKQIKVLRNILTPEQFEMLPEWDFEKNPPKRPWDRRRPDQRGGQG